MQSRIYGHISFTGSGSGSASPSGRETKATTFPTHPWPNRVARPSAVSSTWTALCLYLPTSTSSSSVANTDVDSNVPNPPWVMVHPRKCNCCIITCDNHHLLFGQSHRRHHRPPNEKCTTNKWLAPRPIKQQTTITRGRWNVETLSLGIWFWS